MIRLITIDSELSSRSESGVIREIVMGVSTHHAAMRCACLLTAIMLPFASQGQEGGWKIELRQVRLPAGTGDCAPIELVVRDASGQTPISPDGKQIYWQDFDFELTEGAGALTLGGNGNMLCATASGVSGVITVRYPERTYTTSATGRGRTGKLLIPGITASATIAVRSAGDAPLAAATSSTSVTGSAAVQGAVATMQQGDVPLSTSARPPTTAIAATIMGPTISVPATTASFAGPWSEPTFTFVVPLNLTNLSPKITRLSVHVRLDGPKGVIGDNTIVDVVDRQVVRTVKIYVTPSVGATGRTWLWATQYYGFSTGLNDWCEFRETSLNPECKLAGQELRQDGSFVW